MNTAVTLHPPKTPPCIPSWRGQKHHLYYTFIFMVECIVQMGAARPSVTSANVFKHTRIHIIVTAVTTLTVPCIYVAQCEIQWRGEVLTVSIGHRPTSKHNPTNSTLRFVSKCKAKSWDQILVSPLFRLSAG